VDDSDLPLFQHVKGFVSEEDRAAILSGIALGHDPSSAHFAARTKAIRFVTIIQGKPMAFAQNYFVQNADYNDFSGGLRRVYSLIPSEWIEESGPVGKMVLQFAEYYRIPEKTVILVQIQTSFMRELNRTESITGQGIHTDGADRACIVCLHRGSGIFGPANQFHAKLDGSKPLTEPKILEHGEACFFKDNEVYHYVTPGGCKKGADASAASAPAPSSETQEASVAGATAGAVNQRTIMIMHAPAEIYMMGIENKNNTLGSRVSSVKLRDENEKGTETVEKAEKGADNAAYTSELDYMGLAQSLGSLSLTADRHEY